MLAATATTPDSSSQEVVAQLLSAIETKQRSTTEADLESVPLLAPTDDKTKIGDAALLATTAINVSLTSATPEATLPFPTVSPTIRQHSGTQTLSHEASLRHADEIIGRPHLASASTRRTKTDA